LEGDHQVSALEDEVGHPGDLWDTLKQKVQNEAITQFAAVQDDFLSIIWCLDRYRAEGVTPQGMGRSGANAGRRLEAVYRSKGRWWADLVGLLLENRSSSILAPRARVQGFSQDHRIDVAWPARDGTIEDPRICLVTRMSGAPESKTTPARAAMDDWPNRRKELKFAATDLKLAQQPKSAPMGTWEEWRRSRPPKVFFLWGARLDSKDLPATISREVQALSATYVDGTGVCAYQTGSSGIGYAATPAPAPSGWMTVDEVLDDVGHSMKALSSPVGGASNPATAREATVDTSGLLSDQLSDED
jgi:hypothetical protein